MSINVIFDAIEIIRSKLSRLVRRGREERKVEEKRLVVVDKPLFFTLTHIDENRVLISDNDGFLLPITPHSEDLGVYSEQYLRSGEKETTQETIYVRYRDLYMPEYQQFLEYLKERFGVKEKKEGKS